MTTIEMQDLSERKTSHTPQRDAEPSSAGPDITSTDELDQSVTIWAYGATVILSGFAFILIFMPSVLLFLSETALEPRHTLTPLESFLTLHGGILLLGFALSLLLNVPNEDIVSRQTKAAPGHPLLVPLTTSCTISAFLSYNEKSVASLGFVMFLGTVTISVWGLWTILFAGSSYHSRKTGADKRTSRFLFGNRTAASSQRKQWKKDQAAR